MLKIYITPPAEQSAELMTIVTALAPHILWAAVILCIIILIGPKRLAAALPNVRKIGIAGFEVELGSELADAAAAKNISVPEGLRDQAARRAERLAPLFSGARILWIDDHPTNNRIEVRILRQLGVQIDIATSDADARARLASGVYDAILSDMARGNAPNAGAAFLPEALNNPFETPVIFYVGSNAPLPQGAAGITTRPDDLLNLLMDQFERRRG